MSRKLKHRALTLGERVNLIKAHSAGKLSAKDLLLRFKCGKTQIYEILKRKDVIMSEWLGGCPSRRKRKSRITGNEELNEMMKKWYDDARSENILLSGPLMQAKAMEVAARLGLEAFRASNGWLESFKSRHNITWYQVCGRAADTDTRTVRDWQNNTLAALVDGYDPRDIYCGDETGLFFKLAPSRHFLKRKETCSIGERSSERLTVFLCANMAGVIEKPIVIGDTAHPSCFGNLEADSLPVTWKANDKAWMTRQIMKEWLIEFDRRMESEGRRVVLFLNEALCHPRVSLSNVSVSWLPTNTTALTQPMNHGIVCSFKQFYRKLFLESLAAKITNSTTLRTVLKSLTLLHAISWISRARKSVAPATVTKSFVKSGFPIDYHIDEEVEDAGLISEIKDLSEKLDIEVDPTALTQFDNLLTTSDLYETATEPTIRGNEVEENNNDEADERNGDGDDDDDDDDESKDKNEGISNYSEALFAVDSLRLFAALKNSPRLMRALERVDHLLNSEASREATCNDSLQLSHLHTQELPSE